MKIVIHGNPVTKKNSQNVVFVGEKCPVCHKGKRAIPMQSSQYKMYEKLAAKELPTMDAPIDKPVEVTCLFYMKTQRAVDLTNLEEAIDDILVKYGVLADDNNKIIVSHDGSRVLYDKDDPRVEIEIKEIAEKPKPEKLMEEIETLFGLLYFCRNVLSEEQTKTIREKIQRKLEGKNED